MILGGIEAGGTKFVCALGDEHGNVLKEERFPTGAPEPTLAQAVAFFENAEQEIGKMDALGIGTFGPAGINKDLDNYGKILATPKEGWEGAEFLGAFAKWDIPKAFDTDVNAAALGEGAKGAAVGLKNFVYITVGTGIGGGVVINGQTLSGYLHPEIGHISIRQLDDFEGVCPFHKNCAEGMASGTAMRERWGKPAQKLSLDHPAWELEAAYLASLCQTLTAVLSPQRIILGGGVMGQDHLLPMIQKKFDELCSSYWQTPNNYLVRPELGNQAGIVGALRLAQQAFQE